MADRIQPTGLAGDYCDIVVPVYRGVHYFRDLVRSIRKNTDYPYRLYVIDDSADEGTHRALTELLAGDERAELYRNEQNIGFVLSSNLGLGLGRAEFVCLMNSDTLVSSGWLSRMVKCARSDERIAVVNPFGNRASELAAPLGPGLNLNTMAAAIERNSRRHYPDVTTGNGFCMLLRRRVLDSLGAFDEAYKQGYCEESDMCMRFTEAGYRVVVCDDAFVYHKGQGSFGARWRELFEANRKIFDSRWQAAYQRDYAKFKKRNPLQYIRDAVLRHTIRADEWSMASAMLVERNGRRQSAGKLRDNEPERRLAKRAAWLTRRPRTEFDPRRRELRYPTRAYFARMPRIDGLRITYLVADQMTVCGGMTSIVQLARELTLAGHDVRIATICPELAPERFNLPCQPLVFPTRAELIRLLPASDVIIATYWTTAADYMPALRRRLDAVTGYFVQDYEPWFYPDDDVEMRRRVAATYQMTEHRIVKSRWLGEIVRSQHGVGCETVHLGLDLGIFRRRPRPAFAGRKLRVIAMARPNEPHRGFAELVAVFGELCKRRSDIEFVVFGTREGELPRELPFSFFNAGLIEDMQQVADLIGSCDILIDPSHFQGLGRPGLEAMACGTCTVLPSVGGVAEYARDGENCLTTPPRQPGAIVQAVLRLLDDSMLRDRLIGAGLETVRRFCHIDEAQRHLALYERWVAGKRLAREFRQGVISRIETGAGGVLGPSGVASPSS